MSAGIQHLLKAGKTRPARIDSMEADQVNSIIERISGVNPSKLVAEATGKKVESAPVTAPMTPAAQGFDPYLQRAGVSQDGGIQQMQQRMQMLEERLAFYEQGKGDPAFSADHGPSNRGPESRVWRRDMDPKKAKKKDSVDGEPDSKQAQQPEGQAMAGEHMNILGMSMTEWRDLAGLGTPSIDLTSGRVPEHVLAESQEEYEEYTEDYYTEDELAEAWFEFLDSKGFDPGEFAAFAEAAEEFGDEVALLAIQDLEDEFQEAVAEVLEAEKEGVEAYLRRGGQIEKLPPRKARGAKPLSRFVRGKGAARDRSGHRLPANVRKAANEDVELSQEDIDELWSDWLEDRGLSVSMFNRLIDEAIASEDQEEMDALLAVEELFNQFLEQTTWEIKKRLRGMAGKEISPEDLGMKRKLRGAGAEAKKMPAATMIGGPSGVKKVANEGQDLPPMHPKYREEKPGKKGEMPTRKQMMAKPEPAKTTLPLRTGLSKKGGAASGDAGQLDKMLARSKHTLRREHLEALRRRLAEGTPVSKDDPIHKEVGSMKSIAHKLIKQGPAQGTPIKGFKSLVKKSREGGKEDPRGWAKKWGLADSIQYDEDGLSFECDSDDQGGPSIPWARIMKAYKKKSKAQEERGFGGMSREGF